MAATKIPKGIELITQFVRGQFAKRSARNTGIASLKKASDSIVQSNVKTIEIILKNMGVDPNNLKSTDDILKHMNYHKAMVDQHLKKQFQKLDLGGGWTGIKSLEKKQPFQGFNPRVQQDVDSIIKDLKNMEPVAAMKEANLIIGRKAKYKNLSGDESQRILKETDDHIFQRDIKYDEFGDPIKPDPEDMASGGRTGYAAGTLVKGGKWFLKNLKKAYDEIIEGKGAYSKLDSMQREDLKWQVLAQIKQVERGGPIPDEAIQMIRQDPKFANVSRTRSTDPDLYEFEDVVLNYNKDVDRMKDISQKIELEDFDVTGQTKHAEGGRIGYAGGGIFKLLKMLKSKPKPKSNKLSEQDVAALKKKYGLDPESAKKDDEAFKLRLQQILAKHSTKHAEGGRVSYTKGGLAQGLGV